VGGEVREGGVAFRVGHFIMLREREGERERFASLVVVVVMAWVRLDYWPWFLDWIIPSCRVLLYCAVMIEYAYQYEWKSQVSYRTYIVSRRFEAGAAHLAALACRPAYSTCVASYVQV
jgi:hypothetical protein